MSKLHKVNKNGTLSVILPKEVAHDWQEGEEVTVERLGNDVVFACKHKSNMPLDKLLQIAENTIKLCREALEKGIMTSTVIPVEDTFLTVNQNQKQERFVRDILADVLAEILKKL